MIQLNELGGELFPRALWSVFAAGVGAVDVGRRVAVAVARGRWAASNVKIDHPIQKYLLRATLTLIGIQHTNTELISGRK
jgi:hypothetical protein